MAVTAAGALLLAGVITLAVVDHGSSACYNTPSQRWVLPRLGALGKVSLVSLHGRPVVSTSSPRGARYVPQSSHCLPRSGGKLARRAWRPLVSMKNWEAAWRRLVDQVG